MILIKKLNLFLIILIISAFAGCEVKGTVTYKGVPVKGLIIIAKSGSTIDSHAVTDENGNYAMEITSKSATIKALNSAYTFSPVSQSVNFSSSSEVKTVNFEATNKIPFQPSIHGFKFINSFTIPVDKESMQFPDENDDEGAKYRDFAVDLNPDTGEAMGLCGGMATLAKDFYNAGLPVPDRRSVPYPSDTDAFEDELYNAIWYRLYDTFGGPALVPGVYDNVIKDMDDGYLDKNLYHPIASEQCDLEKMLWWMGEYEVEGEGGLHERTKPEVEKMIARVDQGQLVDIFIMKQNDPSKNWEVGYMTEVGKNHQVLVHDYEITEENQISLRVYEPNAPLSDNEKINIFYDNDGNIVNLTKTGNDTYKVLGIFIGKHVFGSKIPSDTIIKELAL